MKSVALRVLLLTGILYGATGLSATPDNVRASLVVVEKNKHLMILYANNEVLSTYHVSLGRGGSAAKQREGDDRTPEGRYIIDARNDHSAYYKSLHISYPSAEDTARARKQGARPGGAVMIHGLRNDLKWLGPLHRLKDWTRGCVAVTNSEMDELWSMVDIGTPVEIRP